MTTAESLKSTLSAIFCRRGQETSATKLFENWPLSVRSALVSDAALHVDEQPVLAFVPTPDRWLLITTSRILDHHKGNTVEFNVDDLSDVDLALAVDAAKGANRKSELKTLRLGVRESREYLLELEPGAAHIGIWNLLLHFTVLNARKRRQ